MIQLTSPLSVFCTTTQSGVIEPDCTGRLQVVHSKLRAGFALLCGAEGRETQHIARLLLQELGEAPLVVVVCAHEIKNGLLGLQRREVAPPTERLCLGQTVVGLVELDGAPLDRELGDLAGEILGDAFLEFQPGEVGSQGLVVVGSGSYRRQRVPT